MAILESKLTHDETFARQAEHWRSEMARLREEEARLRMGGGAKAQAAPTSRGDGSET